VGLVFEWARDSGVYLPQARYAWALNRVNRGNTLFIQTIDSSANGAFTVARAVRQFLEDNNLSVVVGNLMEVDTVAEIVYRQLTRYTIVVSLLSMMALVIAIVGSVGLSGALSLSVLERTGEIGVMRAIGASSTRISLMFIGEGLIQGLLSWLIAVPLGLPAAYLLTTVVLSPLFGDTLLYQFQPTALLLWLVIIVVLGVVASWLPARKATRVSVRESLAYQ
jgi:putative ABC transport system permease protein